ncbi:inositol monophosphatase family protein [Streptantibioticus ferralitis]|uniref:3'(2'),5'-bisphosphate nucleotidase CysQ n=1 Tax=Streptantibioticus ferralitis TaxID=236510 RepID=A0ABT5YU44_9ACTN|nr:inositol monophosphatase family protein [Streptantibioticus ferralitis]MDF2255127.1 3'(2'),5'-bisphosphate nucleotidase CysQ [Streptantibioticus ferralitis]
MSTDADNRGRTMPGTHHSAGAGAAAADQALLPAVAAAVQAAGARMLQDFSYDARPQDRTAVAQAIQAGDAVSLQVLRDALLAARPGAGWVEDELESGDLPEGEWWICDPVEGAINHVHGMTNWCVTATLVRDNVPVVTAVSQPTTGNLYTAVRGGGAHLDGVRLRPSAKTALDAAYVSTGQAAPGEGSETHRRIGQSVTAMLADALLVCVAVPATSQLVHVAAGRMDAFWQHSQVRSGLVPGALLVSEAGGTVTDTHGRPWTLASPDFLAAAPGIHQAAVDILSTIA